MFVEGSVTAEGTIQMGVMELIFKLKFVGFKFTPLDFTLAVDMEIPQQREKESQVIGQPTQTESFVRYCSSLGYFFEVFDLQGFYELNINECSIGMLGAFCDRDDFCTTNEQIKQYVTQDQKGYSCNWRRYTP